jgi:hypothetical protein
MQSWQEACWARRLPRLLIGVLRESAHEYTIHHATAAGLSRIKDMATRLYGSVFFGGEVAGTLEQVPDGRFAFACASSSLDAGGVQIAYTLPRQEEPHYSFGLHAFSIISSPKDGSRGHRVARLESAEMTVLRAFWPSGWIARAPSRWSTRSQRRLPI